MKITALKTFVIDCFRTNWVFMKVETDEGVSGIGVGTLEYKENALVGAQLLQNFIFPFNRQHARHFLLKIKNKNHTKQR